MVSQSLFDVQDCELLTCSSKVSTELAHEEFIRSYNSVPLLFSLVIEREQESNVTFTAAGWKLDHGDLILIFENLGKHVNLKSTLLVRFTKDAKIFAYLFSSNVLI